MTINFLRIQLLKYLLAATTLHDDHIYIYPTYGFNQINNFQSLNKNEEDIWLEEMLHIYSF